LWWLRRRHRAWRRLVRRLLGRGLFRGRWLLRRRRRLGAVVMQRLPESERKGVEAAIAAAEPGTTGAIVAGAASRADRSHVVILTGCILAAFAAAVIVLLIEPWASLLLSLAAQCVAFAVVYAVLELTPLSVRLAPRKAHEVKARRLAHLLFMERGLASLPEHNGVLLLVALAHSQVDVC